MSYPFREVFHHARAIRAALTPEQQEKAREITQSETVFREIDRLALCLDDRERRQVACLPVITDASMNLVLELQGTKENLMRIRDEVAPEIFLEPHDLDEGEIYHLIIPFKRLVAPPPASPEMLLDPSPSPGRETAD